MTPEPRVLLFDVNETLLDLAALDAPFEEALGRAEARREWFQALKELALTSVITGPYRDFGVLADAALDVTAGRYGAGLRDDQKRALLKKAARLPPHPEVPGALRALREGGFRLAALTNGTPSTVRAQMRHAGLEGAFEAVLSADETRRLKPAPEPYRMAADRLGVAPGEVRMVAAHAWDLAGARAAGLATAFVARPGQTLDPSDAAPDLQGADLQEVAALLLQRSLFE